MITELLLSTVLLAGTDRQQGLADLASRLQTYLDVRAEAAQTVPPPVVTNDRAATIAATDALAAAIVRSRAQARPGDIFTPQIAATMRAAIASGCAGGFDELRRAIDEDLETPLPPTQVNGRWPVGAPLPTMPPDVLEALPPLPKVLEYRFMNTALVLRDIDANVIVDFVSDAIPPSSPVLPARLVSGPLPPLPVRMLGGGQVFLELTLDLDGRVVGVKPLRETPPLTGLIADAVRDWRFDPSYQVLESASSELRFSYKMPRVSKVFVGAVFRAPTVAGPTLGNMPADTDKPDAETPFPLAVSIPGYPLAAFGAGIVVVELHVDADGSVSDARLVDIAPPFNTVALDAARQFRFRPARVGGTAVPAYAYLLFGFPLPITHETAR